MNGKVCVNCNNQNPVNGKDNRLVTESCGHVKCMRCLLSEKSGCAACQLQTEDINLEDSLTPETVLQIDDESVQTDAPELLKEVIKGRKPIEIKDEIKKRKLDISHIRVEPEGSQHRYTCTICQAKFNTRNHVMYHAYCNKKQKKPYQCTRPECRNHEGFSTISHYKYHMQAHNNQKDYGCDHCDKSFICKSKLERHKLKHTKEKKFKCSTCSKGFNNKSALRKHNLLHTGERPHACQTCGMRFRDLSNYKKHLAKHSEKKCTCGVCGLALGCRRALSAHAHRHERRQHACDRCHMAFHTRKDLRRHHHIHDTHTTPEDSKPFVCDHKDCGRRFRRKDNLVRHVRNTHLRTHTHTPDCDGQNGTITPEPTKKVLKDEENEVKEKTKLQILNPLPPLSDDVIQKHLYTDSVKPEKTLEKIDKSYIIEANHARESVIVSKTFDRKIPSPETEYVHKIRRANLTNKEITLPPIDEMKFLKVLAGDKNDLDVGPLPKNIQTLKSILHDKSEMHWKKRLADNE